MIDLRNAKPGDKLITRSGRVLTYVSYDPSAAFWPHYLKYDGTVETVISTRTDEGYFEDGLIGSDEDIIEIIPQ